MVHLNSFNQCHEKKIFIEFDNTSIDKKKIYNSFKNTNKIVFFKKDIDRLLTHLSDKFCGELANNTSIGLITNEIKNVIRNEANQYLNVNIEFDVYNKYKLVINFLGQYYLIDDNFIFYCKDSELIDTIKI